MLTNLTKRARTKVNDLTMILLLEQDSRALEDLGLYAGYMLIDDVGVCVDNPLCAQMQDTHLITLAKDLDVSISPNRH